MIFKYKLVATGGTFDRFHKGHQTLLERAFLLGEKVIIGVTSDNWVKKQNKILKEIVLAYKKRVEEIQKFLQKKGFLGREIIEKLENVYGPTVVNGKVEALVCTRETRSGVSLINRLRARKRKRKLAIVECSFISSSDHFHISSTRIRLGQIDRQGQILTKQPFGRQLPDKLRGALAKPVGTLYPDVTSAIKIIPQPVMLISVGDMVYQKLMLQGINPSIAIVDLKIGRKKLTISSLASQVATLRGYRGQPDYAVKNKHGTVSRLLIKTVKKAVGKYLKTKKPILIKVIGEEDLAVLPAILTAPLESIILYGQPPVKNSKGGVVKVVVTEEKKRWAVELLRQFQ